MTTPAISIIIPTLNGAGRLPRTLASLTRVRVPVPFEVIVVDDGSRDGSAAAARAFEDRLPLKVLSHEGNRGRAAARNTGIRNAVGGIVLLLDDDMEVEEDLVARHLAVHVPGTPPTGAVGRIVTDGLDPDNPFHAYLLREDRWRRERLLAASSVDFGEMLTGQFSIERQTALDAGLFDEAIGAYGLEDIDFAYRLSRGGARFVYLDEAVSHHEPFAIDLDVYCERHRMVGEVAAYLARRHGTPEMRRYLRLEPMPRNGRRSPFTRMTDFSTGVLRRPGIASALTRQVPQSLLRGGVRALEALRLRRALAFAYVFMRDIQYFAAIDSQRERSVLVLYDPSQAGITAHVRGFHFQRPFAERGWRMELEAYTPAPEGSLRRPWRECAIALRARRFGLVYLLKVPSLSLIRRLKSIAGAPVVFDLTDSLWRREVGGDVWGDLDLILSESNAVFTCNTYDTEYAARFSRNTETLTPYADVAEYLRTRALRPQRTDGLVRIGWVGSPSTVRAIGNVAQALDRTAQRTPGVELRVVGCRDAADLPTFQHLPVSLGPADYDQRTMIEEILDMDVGIYPIVIDEEDYRIRGPLKALNYMAAGVPCVAQRAGEVARIIRDGESGMLASTPDEWETKIERLLRDPALRRELGDAGLRTVRASFSFEGAVDDLEAAFTRTLARARGRSWLTASVQSLQELARAGMQTGARALAPGRRNRDR